MKIDVHAHIVDRRYLDGLTDLMGLTVTRRDNGQTLMRKGNTTCAWYRDNFFTAEDKLRSMDEKGIDRRLISLSSPSVYDWPIGEQIDMARYINDATAALCRAHPDRFSGLGTMPLGDTGAALEEIDRALDELDMVGLAIGSNIAGRPLNDPELEPVWARINERRIPVFEHPMDPLGADHMDEFELPIRVGFVYDTTTALTRMIYGGLFERYPDFPFIIAHTGGALLMLLGRLDNGYRLFEDCRRHISKLPSEYAKSLFYDTCAFAAPSLMLAHSIVGPERLLWGTDDPFIGSGSEHVDDLPLDDADKAMILGGNAARVFGLAA